MLSDICDSPLFRYFQVAFLISILIYAVVVEPFNLQVTENSFDLFADNDSALTIVLISDIHDSYNYPEYLQYVIGTVNSQQPDLILIAGDNIEGIGGDWEKLGALEQLRSRYGVYAVLGNHDYLFENCNDLQCSDKIKNELEARGIEVLTNEHRILDINGREFALIGLEDLWTGRSNYPAAAAGVPDNMTQIILAHNYLSMENETIEGSNLVLSGHTHCGQINVPLITKFLLWMGNFGDAVGGRFMINENTDAYITCGIVPGGIRLFAPPEVSVIYVE